MTRPLPLSATEANPHAPQRALSLLDCIGIGINGIVGSGVFLMLSPLAKAAGAASVLGILGCGLLCILIAFCFAELSSTFDRNGGAYVYARVAFGRHTGFAVGWLSAAVGVLAFSAVAVGFGDALTYFWPSLAHEAFRIGSSGAGLALPGKTVVACALITVLGIINLFGVKAGARTSDLLSAAKLLPLIALAVVGLFWFTGDLGGAIATARSGALTSGTQWDFSSVARSAFLAVFMISGFEYVAVPAGEAKQARRNIPIAIVASLMGATVLFCVLQAIALSTVPNLADSAAPLVDAAVVVFGPKARLVFGLAALVSMAGFCAGSALVGPRYFSALAEDGYLPETLRTLSGRGTPAIAIAVCTAISVLLAIWLGYASLVDVSNVVLFLEYIPTAAAVIVLRRTMPDADRRYRLPGGDVIPALAVVASVALLWAASPRREEWITSLEILAAGLVVWGAVVASRRLAGPQAGKAAEQR